MPAFLAIEGTRLPEGTASATVDGAPIGFGSFTLRGYAPVDADGDHDDDLVIALQSETELAVGYARRDGTRFSQSMLSRSPRDPSCTLGEALIRVLATDLAVVERRLTCGGAPGLEITPVTLGSVSRAPEHVSVRMPIDDPFLEALTVVPQANDADHDGASDLGLVITSKARGIARAETETLLLRSVASGMVPDLAAIGTRIGTLERSARRDLEASTARALRDSSRAAALAFSVCPDTARPAIRFQGSANTGCSLGDRHVRALSTWAAALVRSHRVDDAAALLFAFGPRGVVPDAASERVISRALGTSPERRAPPYTTYIVPQLADARALAFAADGSLIVRAATDIRLRISDSPTLEPVLEGDPALARFETHGGATDAGTSYPPFLRFGESIVLRSGVHARIVGLPMLDGGRLSNVVVDDAQHSVACLADGHVQVAVITP